MNIFPAIDLYDGKAVRLVRGEYDKMTIYSDNPPQKACEFKAAGAEYLHVVDLEGARDGATPNLETVRRIVAESGLKTEIGGGIRSEEAIEKYLEAGVMRVILGTAAITEPGFLGQMASRYGDKIAVGVDIKDGMVAIRGWTEVTEKSCFDFCRDLEQMGIKTIICTDISRDGLLSGTNLELYREMSETFAMDIIASGGVTGIEEIKRLREMGMYGAIVGKAIYTGDLDLAKALQMARGE